MRIMNVLMLQNLAAKLLINCLIALTIFPTKLLLKISSEHKPSSVNCGEEVRSCVIRWIGRTKILKNIVFVMLMKITIYMRIPVGRAEISEKYTLTLKSTLNKQWKNFVTNSSGTSLNSRAEWIKGDNYEPLDLCIRFN